MARQNVRWGFGATSGIVFSNNSLTVSTPVEGGNTSADNFAIDHTAVAVYGEFEVEVFSGSGTTSPEVEIGILVVSTGSQGVYYRTNGDLTDTVGGNTPSWGASYTTGDTIGMAIKNSKIYFSGS